MILSLVMLQGGAPEADGVVDEASGQEVESLVRRAQSGDRSAARDLYRLHAQRLWRVVRPLCASDADAEDVVQDAFVKAFGALDRYQPRPGLRFLSWLSTIALNTARNRARKLGRLRLVEPVVLTRVQEAAGPTELADTHDPRLRIAMLTALQELPERDRQVVTLRYGGELSVAEVAQVASLSEPNVRKICERRRAALLQRIRTLLEEKP